MKAVLIKDGKGPIENLYIGEAPRPVPKNGQVLVKVKAFGINRADTSQRQGRYPPPPGASQILGLEFSGTIEEIGEGVDSEKWKIGDEVIALTDGGAYAEYISCANETLMKKPPHLNWVEAASIPEVYLTAYQALIKLAELQQNEDVLIHAGASGVGIAAIQLARFFGARSVTATASSQAKLDWLLSHGATHAANYKTEDFSEVVKKATGDKGANVVIDMVGQSHWAKNINSLGHDGRMIILAVMSGNIVHEADLAQILYKRLRIQGSTLRARSLGYKANLVASFQKDVLEHITNETGKGELKTYIHRVFPWRDIQAAHREMEENKNIGKIIVEVA